MDSVFVLWHVYKIDEDRDEEKLIGIYSTEEAAEKAIKSLSDQPGFVDHPDGFLISKMRLDRTGWSKGFVRA